jgi:hypothetical protein
MMLVELAAALEAAEKVGAAGHLGTCTITAVLTI